MSEKIDWSKAPEWAKKHGLSGAFKSPVWFDDEKYTYVDRPQDGKEFFYADACTYAAKDFSQVSERPTTPSWSGEGLPPVGVVCEYNAMPIGKPEKWHKVEAVYVSGWVIVLRCIEAPDGHEAGNGVEIAVAVDSSTLKDIRPIRTPEQIAADERESAIKEIEYLIAGYSYRHCAELIHDNGYRRP